MRQVINPQLQFGSVDISLIEIRTRSRDDIPQILRGLQYIYSNQSLRESVFKLLETHIQPKVDKNNGRPGMELWKVLVLGVIRLDLNCDYDRVHELANEHKTLRQMLGHSDFFDDVEYSLQTIKDNVSLLTLELLEEINTIVVAYGHDLVKKKDEQLHGRCDSFVVETDVHYPTDYNLLFDAMRKAIQLTAKLCEKHEMSDFRQYAHNIRQIKHHMRTAQQTRRKNKATSINNGINPKTEEKHKKSCRDYIGACQYQLDQVESVIAKIELDSSAVVSSLMAGEINYFIDHAKRQIDQITRRVLNGEVIPHSEKVFSIFEPHTEWISKGKAGVPVEFGLRVCILEDQHQFILHHKVMEEETDDKVAILMVEECQHKFPELNVVSFDKGFHSKENQEELQGKLDLVAMPRKGRLSEAARLYERSEGFKSARKQHSAVESAINALEVHGLDICRDHGLERFKRYVALAVVTRNIHRIGAILHKQEQKRLLKQKLKKAEVDNDIQKAA